MIRTDAKVSIRGNSPEMSRDKLIHLVTIGVISVLSLLLSLAPLHAQTQATINATARSDFIEAQLKRNGLSTEKLEKKGLYLRYIWSEEKLDRWIDANTAFLYTGLRKVIAKREDPGEMSDGFGADFLFTIKFDAAGNWKIVKTHSMSQKEVDKRGKEQ